MGNYFDKEREIGIAAREFNKKMENLKEEYRDTVEKFIASAAFIDTPINESSEWFMFKHSPVVSLLFEYDYINQLYSRSAKYYEEMSLTEELVFGEDNGKTERIKNIHDTIDIVENLKTAYINNDVDAILENADILIPLYCLFNEDAIVEANYAKLLKDKLEKQKEIEQKNNDELGYDENIQEEYLEEAKKRKNPRPAKVVKKAYKLRKYAARLAQEDDVVGAVEANDAAKALESNADEILAKEKRK